MRIVRNYSAWCGASFPTNDLAVGAHLGPDGISTSYPDRRVEIVLDGGGLRDLDRNLHTGEPSGGQRARVQLAALLLRRADTRLLDEPAKAQPALRCR